MEKITNHKEFQGLLHYAIEMKFQPPYGTNGVPSIGIAFGNYEIPTKCYEYMNRAFVGNKLKIDISPGDVTRDLDITETDEGGAIFSCPLNYDKADLMNFKSQTPEESAVVLLFGVRHQCDYYVTGNEGEKQKTFRHWL